MNTTTIGIANLSPEANRRQRVYVHLQQDGGDPSQLLELLATIVEQADWERLTTEDGAPLSFEAYITQPYPTGIGWTLADVRTVLRLHHKHERGPKLDPEKATRIRKMRERIAGLLAPERMLAEVAAGVPERIEPETSEKKPGPGRGNKTSSERTCFSRGETIAYLTDRIARARPDVHKRMKNGEFSSVRAAALEAGIIKAPTSFDLLCKAWRKASPEAREQFLAWINEQKSADET